MKKKLLMISTILMGIIILTYGFYNLYFSIKLNKILKGEEYSVVKEEKDNNITINIKKGNEYANIVGILPKFIITPQIAIWIEDTEGVYIKTLYVTPKLSKIKRDSALPIWSHIAGTKVDTTASATPKDNINLEIIKPNLEEYNILLEVNKSYDDNKYYNIGKEYNGQPSLIYKASINKEDKIYKMEPIGHGSSVGDNGFIFKDLSGITTAKNILKNIEVIVK